MAKPEQLRCGVFSVYVKQGADFKEFIPVCDIVVYSLPLLISG